MSLLRDLGGAAGQYDSGVAKRMLWNSESQSFDDVGATSHGMPSGFNGL